MILVVAQRWSRRTPEVAILAIFSPPGFVRLHGGAGSNLPFDRFQDRLGMLDHAVQQLHDLPRTDLASIEDEQQRPNVPHRQAHERTQQGNQAAQADADPSLPQGLLMQIYRGLVPLLTLRAPAFENPMMDHLDWLRLRQLDHFSHAFQADPAQPQMTLGTTEDAVLHDLRWHRTHPASIVLGLPFLSWLFLFCRALLHVLFHKLWRFARLFQFLNPPQRQA